MSEMEKLWQQLGQATISKRVAGTRDFEEIRVPPLQAMPCAPYKRLAQCAVSLAQYAD